mmetsp:Transcript_20787/g.18412  ORF Transcript_20787/g.18412 Transcript_20787/m.18412 type:complete len:115 (-) Transcript_20787:78-422(-)
MSSRSVEPPLKRKNTFDFFGVRKDEEKDCVKVTPKYIKSNRRRGVVQKRKRNIHNNIVTEIVNRTLDNSFREEIKKSYKPIRQLNVKEKWKAPHTYWENLDYLERSCNLKKLEK